MLKSSVRSVVEGVSESSGGFLLLFTLPSGPSARSQPEHELIHARGTNMQTHSTERMDFYQEVKWSFQIELSW